MPGRFEPGDHVHLPDGRRTVLTLLATAFAVLGLAANAFAATSVTFSNTAGDTPAGTTPAVQDNLFHTTGRGSFFKFTAVGANVNDHINFTCQLDNVVSACSPASGLSPATSTFNGGTLDLGSHEFIVTATDTDDANSTDSKTYTWRIEPVGYAAHIIGHSPETYFKLDDAVNGSQTVLDSGPNGHNGTYYNYALPRQQALTACQNQPHQPYACSWLSDIAPFTGPEAKGYSFYFGGNANDNSGIQSDDSIDWHDTNFPASDWTVEMWIKPTAVGENQGLYEHDAVIWIDSANHVNCAQMNDQGTAGRVATSTETIAAGSKYYIACRRTGHAIDLFVYDFSYPGNNPGPQAPHPDHSTATAVADPSNNMDSQGKIGLVNVPNYANFDGYIDNVADYYSSLSDNELKYHWELGAVDDDWYGQWKTNGTTSVTQDVAPPSAEPPAGGTSIASPLNNAQYSPDAAAYKIPTASFSCWDPQPDNSKNYSQLTSGTATQVDPGFAGAPNTPNSCTATLDGVQILNGAALALTPGSHTFVLTAEDGAGNTWVHTHTYYVSVTNSGYFGVINCTYPVLLTTPGCTVPLAYYHFDEPAGASTLVDSASPATGPYNGEYKNDQDNSGNPGVVGGGGPNTTRAFFGQGGYAAVNNIAAPLYGYTLETWWKPRDNNGMAIMQHGSNGTIWYDGTKVYFRPDERSANVASLTLPNPGSGHWYYVAGVYDGINATLYLGETIPNVDPYTNVLLNSNTVQFHAKDGAGSDDTFYLGFANDITGVTSPWLRGELDEAAYYGTALASAKVNQHFNADPPAGDVTYGKSISKPSKLAAAKAKVKAATKALAKAKAKVKLLKRHHARTRLVHKAQVNVKVKAKALAKAKARVRALSRH